MVKKIIFSLLFTVVIYTSLVANKTIVTDLVSGNLQILNGNIVNTVNGQTGDVNISTSSITGFVRTTGDTMTGDLITPNLVSNNNISFGTSILISTGTTTGSTPLQNMFIGNGGQLNTTGARNSALGFEALKANTSGSDNVAHGTLALISNTIGSFNSALGAQALSSNNTGVDNTAMGSSALGSNTSGYSNTSTGKIASYANTTGYNNTSNGALSLFANKTGYNNIAMGYKAGMDTNLVAGGNDTVYNSIYLGANTKSFGNGNINEIVIGYDAIGAGSNTVVLGNTDISTTVLRGNVRVSSVTFNDGTILNSTSTIGNIQNQVNLLNNNVTITKEPTGFVSSTINNSTITVTYNVDKTVTLSGTFQGYYRGIKILDINNGSWTSAACPNVIGQRNYFLAYDGSNWVWKTTIDYSDLNVAYVYYRANGDFVFANRETHGLMQWQTHKRLHETIGSSLESGGDLSGITLNSSTPANRRPAISSTVINDEDLGTINNLLVSGTYTNVYNLNQALTSLTDRTEIIPLSANNFPQFNSVVASSWTLTEIPSGNYMSVWVAAKPVTADTQSQKYRYIFVNGQSTSASLATEVALTPSSLNMLDFNNIAPEFVVIAKIIVRRINNTNNNWQIVQIDKLTGTRLSQTATPAGNFLSVVNHDTTLAGEGTVASPLSATGVFTSTITATAVTINNGLNGNISLLNTSNSTTTFITANGTSYFGGGNVQFNKKIQLTPSATQILASTNTITSDTSYSVVVSTGGAVTLSSNPQIAAGTYAGQILKIRGTSDTNTITLIDGNGVDLDFATTTFTMGLNDNISLMWNGSVWYEESRKLN